MTVPESAAADAVADLRTTLKWIIGAAAGTAALLVGTGPVAAMGKFDDKGDVVAAFCGLALAVTGVGWIIWQASEALMPQICTLAQFEDSGLRDLEELRELGRIDPHAFYGPYDDLADLRSKLALHDEVAANAAVMLAKESDERRAKMLQQRLEAARANAEQARRLERRLLVLVHTWLVRAAVRRARRHAFAAMIAVVVGAVLFLTSVNDSKPEPSGKKDAAANQLMPVLGSPYTV
ncbi:hypothetical protein [Streptomyces aureus]